MVTDTERMIGSGYAFPQPCHATLIVSPNRSLSDRGQRVVVGLFGACVGLLLLLNWSRLVWPIVLPPLLATAALWQAFRANNRSHRHFERIDIAPDNIRVTSSGPALPRHARRTENFHPYWVRVEISTDRLVENRLVLKQSGRQLSIGEFLSPDERLELAVALQDKIRRITRG